MLVTGRQLTICSAFTLRMAILIFTKRRVGLFIPSDPRGENGIIEIASSRDNPTATSTSSGMRMRTTGSSPSADDVRKRMVAGYSVTIMPRGNVDLYSKVPGQRQFSVNRDGKTITFRSDKNP